MNSRPLEEKLNLLHYLVKESKDPELDAKVALYCINTFIQQFLPTFDEQD
jgi:hypothetical protein